MLGGIHPHGSEMIPVLEALPDTDANPGPEPVLPGAASGSSGSGAPHGNTSAIQFAAALRRGAGASWVRILSGAIR